MFIKFEEITYGYPKYIVKFEMFQNYKINFIDSDEINFSFCIFMLDLTPH